MSTFEILLASLGVLNALFNLANLALMRSKVSEDKLAAHATQLATLAAHVEAMDSRANGVPTHNDLGKIYDLVNNTRAEVAHMSGEMNQINASLRQLISRQLNPSTGH